MNSRIVHISIDEKFINSAYWQFETVFNNKNYFYVLQDEINTPLKFINKESNIYVVDSCQRFLEQLHKTDILIIHSLHYKFYDIILNLPESIKCIWMCFGYEIYNDNNYISQKKILGKLTKQRFYNRKRNYRKEFKDFIYPLYRALTGKKYYSVPEIKSRVIDRIDYLGTTFSEEYDNVSKLLSLKKPLFNFSYYPLEKIIDVDCDVLEERPNILIGNSGYMTANHIDVFDTIKDFNVTGRKIVVPVSYGSQKYIEALNIIGNDIFGDLYFPLNDYLELDDYNEMISACGVAVFNNFRQQALGNTIALLWYGSKVFLSEKNPLYHYLKRINVHVFSYDAELSEQAINILLTEKQIDSNRTILKKYFGTNILLSNLKKQLLAIND